MRVETSITVAEEVAQEDVRALSVRGEATVGVVPVAVKRNSQGEPILVDATAVTSEQRCWVHCV